MSSTLDNWSIRELRSRLKSCHGWPHQVNLINYFCRMASVSPGTVVPLVEDVLFRKPQVFFHNIGKHPVSTGHSKKPKDSCVARDVASHLKGLLDYCKTPEQRNRLISLECGKSKVAVDDVLAYLGTI